MPRIMGELAGSVSLQHYTVDIWTVLDERGRSLGFVPHLVPDTEPVHLKSGFVMADFVELFPTVDRAVAGAVEAERKLMGGIELPPQDAGNPDLVPGACRECHAVGRVLFQKGAFSYKDGDRVLDHKPIRAFCMGCQHDTEFVPIMRGVSPYLDKALDEWQRLRIIKQERGVGGGLIEPRGQ